MNIIQLFPEQNNLKPLKTMVTDKELRQLVKLHNIGGFRRFGLGLIERTETKRTPYQRREFNSWIKSIFPLYPNPLS